VFDTKLYYVFCVSTNTTILTQTQNIRESKQIWQVIVNQLVSLNLLLKPHPPVSLVQCTGSVGVDSFDP
jgi:hypothetical protein